MKSRSLTALVVVIAAALFPILAAAQVRPAIYPFDITVAGQEAVYAADFPIFAKVPKPVAPDAEVTLGAGAERIIVNVFPCNADGSVPAGITPKVIMVASGTGFKLDKTMDKSVLAPGLYGMNIVHGKLGTSRVMFAIGEAAAPPAPPAAGAPDQSTPEKTVNAIFAAAKSGDYASLKALAPASGDVDGDVKRIRDVADGNAEHQKFFKEWFATGKIAGEARIDGDKAAVDFTFGPKGNRTETMNLARIDGKWYLDSF